jgi:hypothetical protein
MEPLHFHYPAVFTAAIVSFRHRRIVVLTDPVLASLDEGLRHQRGTGGAPMNVRRCSGWRCWPAW